jgi:hypothetical protein
MKEYNADDKNVTRAMYVYEIKALGLEDSEVIMPGMQVDAHVRVFNDGQLPQITFRARVYEIVGHDIEGNAIPSVRNLKYFGQSWDTGGSYLDPTEKDPLEMA